MTQFFQSASKVTHPFLFDRSFVLSQWKDIAYFSKIYAWASACQKEEVYDQNVDNKLVGTF